MTCAGYSNSVNYRSKPSFVRCDVLTVDANVCLVRLIVDEYDAVGLVRGVDAVNLAVTPLVDVNAFAGLAKEPRGVARVRGDGNT